MKLTIPNMASRINAGPFGYNVIPAGAGWSCHWLFEDKVTGLCRPANYTTIRIKYFSLFGE